MGQPLRYLVPPCDQQCSGRREHVDAGLTGAGAGDDFVLAVTVAVADRDVHAALEAGIVGEKAADVHAGVGENADVRAAADAGAGDDFGLLIAFIGHLLQAGLTVVVAQQWGLFGNADILPPGIVLFKTVNKLQAKKMVDLYRRGHIVTATEEELDGELADAKDLVVVAGGDGSIRAVAICLLGRPCGALG